MHGWSRTRKRLLLAAMLLPAGLVIAGSAAAGVFWADGPGAGRAAEVAFTCFLSAFAITLVTMLLCLVDAAIDRRVQPGAGWAAALLLAPGVAPVAYWYLHVRPGPGEPHGLGILPPARAWPPRLKAATAVGAVATGAFFVALMAWIVLLFLDRSELVAAELMLTLLGVWSIVASAVVGLFVLDAAREGGTHAALWITLLVCGWPIVAPLYWLLFVRPTALPDGGP